MGAVGGIIILVLLCAVFFVPLVLTEIFVKSAKDAYDEVYKKDDKK